jgi:hypothetical protein
VPLIGIFALLCALVAGPTPASAEPPVPPEYDGLMTFPAIHGPSDPEEYSWRVDLGSKQKLRLLDDQNAEVYYEDGHRAFGITAEPAHAVDGATVPTTIAVSGEDVITLTVHHRAGNPAAGGASFVYPVTAGTGWEGGFKTFPVSLTEPTKPGPENSAPPVPTCVVPKLAGKSLKAGRKALKTAGCKLGQVRGERSKTAKVAKQSPKPGKVLEAGTEVGVKLGS